MKFTNLFFVVMALCALLLPSSEAAPGKIPINAIKKAGKAIGQGLRAVNIASTAHDIASLFKPKRKRKH
ncbi:virescein-like [Anticarsia gemmatalis]|uniref:virescein-like n=1 Tax=Anticarsia gemmatalis TaxID=129554 RepID=UPI003F768CC6